MVAPSGKTVDMPVGEGFVGMVDREHFDPWLRAWAAEAGADLRAAAFERITRPDDGPPLVHFTTGAGTGLARHAVRARLVVGADGACSPVGRAEVPGHARMRQVFAYHEILRVPEAGAPGAGSVEATRCDVYYQGRHSPDFYSWIFPHGDTLSIGTGSARKGFSLRSSIRALRVATGLDGAETVRREGAPSPQAAEALGQRPRRAAGGRCRRRRRPGLRGGHLLRDAGRAPLRRGRRRLPRDRRCPGARARAKTVHEAARARVLDPRDDAVGLVPQRRPARALRSRSAGTRTSSSSPGTAT